MFFTDELLMAKRGSLGTVWLVSTLGTRSRRVTRKSLAKVEIPQACDLIAKPPEPLALRLSGQLLVGVVRVYNQNYEHFYTDVQTFDTAVRRSIAVDFGPMGKMAGLGGDQLDLPNGGGRTRLELITFGDYDPDTAPFSGLDFQLANIDWLDPDLHNPTTRDLRQTTPLSSLQTQSLRDEENVEEPEGPRVLRRPRYTTPDNISHQPLTYQSVTRDVVYQDDDFQPMDLDLPPIIDDNGFRSDDTIDPGPFDFDVPDLVPDDLNTGNRFDDIIQTPRNSPLGAGDKSKTGSNQEASDVEDVVYPSPKLRKKRVKKTKFDNDLELDLNHVGMEAAYIQAMAERRAQLAKNAREKDGAHQAELLLQGADSWAQFLDSDMSSFINNFTKVPKFKWEVDAESGGGKQPDDPADEAEPDRPSDPVGPTDQNDLIDPFAMNDDPFIDIPVDHVPDITVSDEHIPEMEVARDRAWDRSSQDLPWIDESDDFDNPPGGAGSGMTTPVGLNTPRVSLMTPRERSIRKSQLNSSTTGRRITLNRSRSGSMVSVAPEHLMLVSDDDAIDLPDDDDSTRYPTGHPFSAAMLATLDDQCRGFFSYVDRTMIKAGADQLELTDVAPRGATKHVAATAFYNCLNLATKRMLNLSQAERFGPITIRIPAQ